MFQVALTSFSKAALQAQGPRPAGAHVMRAGIHVGALLARMEGGAGYTFSPADEVYMASMITEGPKIGIWFAPDYRAHVCNLRYQHDFLAMAKRGCPIRPNLLSFNYVYYSRKGSNHCADRRVYSQSMQAFENGIWHDAAACTGASHIINIHKTGEELPTAILEGSAYGVSQTGLLTRDCKRMDVLMRRDLIGQRLVA
ncbi:MAG: hypothetical protein EBQ96_01835 [Proteobacteria bacterium]|nr:hypothetical protein [Pseudomonadota bacterium]